MPAERRTLAELSRCASVADDQLRSRHRRLSRAHRRARFVDQRVHHGAGRRGACAGPRRRSGDRRRPLPRPAARRADLAQGSDRSSRHADDRRLARAARTRGRPRFGGRGATARGRCGVRRQDQPARVRAGDDERGLRVRSGAPSARSQPISRRLLGWIGGLRPGRHVLRLDRLRHRRLDSHSGGRLRSGRSEAGTR